MAAEHFIESGSKRCADLGQINRRRPAPDPEVGGPVDQTVVEHRIGLVDTVKTTQIGPREYVVVVDTAGFDQPGRQGRAGMEVPWVLEQRESDRGAVNVLLSDGHGAPAFRLPVKRFDDGGFGASSEPFPEYGRVAFSERGCRTLVFAGERGAPEPGL